MAAGLVEGGIVGAVIGKLRTSVTDMATKNILFESELGALTEILQSIEPKLLEIEKYNKELDRAEKTKPYIDLLNKGKELVERCSEISPWSFFERSLYSDELTGYKADLLRFCQVELQLEQSSDIKEMLVKLNRVSEVLDYVKGPSFVGKFFLPGSTLTDRVIVPDSTLLKRKDEVLIKDGPAAVLLAPGWFGATTSPVIQDCTDMYENIFLAKHSKMASIKCIVPELFQIKRCHETKDEAYLLKLLGGGSGTVELYNIDEDDMHNYEYLEELLMHNVVYLVPTRFEF
ncbi:hypothetical protein RJ639_021406 [Escallonia herrerae]|uniref:RPW8 domain-containing protein n=1 Tax=Escallonia herrerae TaxID=1293975 RepID=A0AA88V7V1_9ASTE|nr:hypothetical protein RJ639_021406 [Escallonia herrerae]